MPDNKWIDVDFKAEANAIGREMGCIAPVDHAEVEVFRSFKRRYSGTVYPRNQWQELIKKNARGNAWAYRRIVRSFDQGQEGSCTYNAAALADQCIRNRQEGDHNAIVLSPMSGYRHNARGPNSGSTVSGAIKWLARVGLLASRDYAPNQRLVDNGKVRVLHPEVGWNAQFGDEWERDALFFRADEWEWAGSVDEWVSALIDGHVGVGGRDGHAICSCGLTWNDGPLDIYCNSWGMWGDTLETAAGPLKSFGYDSVSKMQAKMRYGDAWILRAVRRPSFLQQQLG